MSKGGHMIYKTAKERWVEFQKRVLPLPNPIKPKRMSLTAFDSFAASVYALADMIRIPINIIYFNRIDKVFEYNTDTPERFSQWYHTQYEDFDAAILFLKYLYNIDRKNDFCREFVLAGTERKFEQLWCFMTAQLPYTELKKIKMTDELIRNFFKKIKMKPDYDRTTSYWDKQEAKKM